MATLQDILGGGLPAGLLSPEQEAAAQSRAQNAALLNFAFGALQASRGQPGQRAPGLGQIIGQAGPVGVQAYQQSFDQTLANALRGMQIGELRRKQAEEDQARQARATFQERIAAATRPATTGAGTQQAEALMGQMMFPGEAAAPTAETAMTREALLSNVNLPRVTDQAAADQAVLDYLRVAAPTEYAKLLVREPKAAPTSIQEYNFAVGQGYKGTFQEFVNEQKKAGATQIVMPGDKKMAEILGKGAGERLDNSLTQAQEAQSTLQNIAELRPIIEQGVFAGPLSGAPRAVAQIASQLGVTGKNTQELLERTAVAMQGLAKFELSAAAAMRGQGAITENERMLIQRAAAGRLDQFTAPEVQALLTAMEKTANFKIASHNRQLDVLRKSPSAEVRDLIPFYELSPLNVSPARGNVRKFNPATGRVE